MNLSEGNEELRVTVKDANFLLPDSFLGQVTFSIANLQDGVPKDEWYSLESRPGKKDKVQGELHLQILYSDRPDGNIGLDDFITPIQVLLKKQKYPQFKNLLEKNTDFLEAKDKDENYPLHIACLLDQPDAVQLLVKKGADVKSKNAKGQTPLHCAAEKSLGSIPHLIEAKADLEAKDKDTGARPIHTAAAANSGKACTLLLEAGANINSVDEKGNTPLHIAIQSQALDAVRVLASTKKVDIYKRNKADLSAAQLGVKAGGDIKRIFMDSVKVEDEREFDIVDSGWKKRHRIAGDEVSPDFQKSTQFVVSSAAKCEVKIICHFIGSGGTTETAAQKIGFCVVTTIEGKHAEVSYQTQCVGYGGETPLAMTLTPGVKYAILPYSQEPEAKGKFSLLVFTKEKEEISIIPLKPWKNSASKKGEWKADSAGGCNNENTWRRNPHFLLRLPKNKPEVELCILLEQQKSSLDIIPYQVHPYAFHIGYYIYDKDVEDILERSVWNNAREVYKFFKFDTSKANHQELIIVPTTVKAGQESSFTVTVYSDEEIELEKFNPPKIVDVTN